MKKYIVSYGSTIEVVRADSPGDAKRLVIKKNQEAGLNLAIQAIRPA